MPYPYLISGQGNNWIACRVLSATRLVMPGDSQAKTHRRTGCLIPTLVTLLAQSAPDHPVATASVDQQSD